MPKIPTNSTDIVFFLYRNCDPLPKDLAARKKLGGGTGFYVSVEYSAGRKYVYGVTNAHIICNYPCLRVNMENGDQDCIELDCSDWISHSTYDIAITENPLPLIQDIHSIVSVGHDTFVTQEKIDEWEIGLGEDVFMMGRFVDGFDKAVNVPVARFGNISADLVPTVHKYRKTTANSYLVDMHSRGGFSGSPVFAYRLPGGNMAKTFTEKEIELGNLFFALLGIHWGQFDEMWESTHPGEPPVTGYSGMTLVDPAMGILELLDMPKVKETREKLEKVACAPDI